MMRVPSRFSRRRVLASFTLAAVLSCAGVAEEVSFNKDIGQLQIIVNDEPVASYVWQDPEVPRPYFCDVAAPNGFHVTRNHPPHPVLDRDNEDHADFHPGIWLAFGDINGQDFWRNKARVRHAEFVTNPIGGENEGTFAVRNVYESSSGERICEERCTYSFHVTQLGYLLTAESEFYSPDGPFVFGDQEEMGFGVRVATPLRVKGGHGSLVNSVGGRDEAGTWGKRADWCAGFGRVNDVWVGVSVMADPHNFRPSWFHSRDYGLIVANPFGKKAMTGANDPSIEPDHTKVGVGEMLRLGFGVYIFSIESEAEPVLAPLYADYLARINR